MSRHRMIKAIFRALGYEVTRHDATPLPTNPFSELTSVQAVDMDRQSALSASIPGMILPRSGEILFSLCLMQAEPGDVVEIGSWQGRSTSYLARAVEQSKNGSFFAVDHFQGNKGKEALYVVGADDLSDLKENFLANMARAGLTDTVNLLDMPNYQAAPVLANRTIRFLFIDGDHTKAGIERDIELFFPLLTEGSIVAFDDFSPQFPGVIETVNRLLEQGIHSRVMTYHRSLVIKFQR